ncbi:RagB/SusD family nutrient uptake outer membrane protein [Mucilaginibacter rubeus]|uniref:RagB/SusD family nutrient uptake outer membrane protein n=1 Tax=Mucilaginibacter rubeus TaxID=2027860 RepID=A0AAE6JH63_9SPHI|nr:MULTISPECIES: RagB/SusD family nutrient uptake outer membrane protein [Mucilaginibacter]QEM05455.1 RagB/SusD family nutrient uptake outer membrane protein [Mucilaginibacter rubeus]QEM18040.1 RagB/SusD family nutrient uptake outer membrane protein [Mucilaginibacter gossypii]QTE45423.1 RagB/SusD family nutrient uptake outer membrane protein [Mucilaginibacter rubeus]QTE52020.1 RagB/SusD family nutrient uptake outer membrane protein [Mucilaginibacter rubeus]QTE57109.1 RagB/SusD family nutrient 
MKKIKFIYISATALALFLSACNKQLNIKPVESVDQNQAIKTAKDVQGVLVGTYNRLGQVDLYGGRIFMEPDLLAAQAEITWTGTYTGLTQITVQAITRDNSFVENTWLDAYQVINQANTVLANLDKADNADDKARWEGEAKFIRGLMYFDLARLFGKPWNDGDPSTNLAAAIVSSPTTSADSEGAKVGRSTVKQVYDQAISDLTAAKSKLPEDNDFYANKYSASAILARLYLQKGDYTNALKEANTVITSGAFSLVPDYTKEFLLSSKPSHQENTTEDIFAIQVTQQQGINSLNEFYASSANGGRGDIKITDDFLAEFEANDVRGQFYTVTSVNRTKKFDNQYGNVHVVRLAEMYLIRAEANLRGGTSTGATPASDVNTIRERAGLDPLVTVNLATILAERRHELCFEGGFFLHDAKRLKQSAGGLPYNSPKLVFPIPQREILANPKLVQNEGY